ncbi:hypothetical protein GYA54_02675 [Candidatus Kuenenbacteria bacterium]|nr:hypothetical protein [Candidatus Kuenenbacteria bacterium]
MNNTIPIPGGENNGHKKVTAIIILLLIIVVIGGGAYLLKKSILGPEVAPPSSDGFPNEFYSYLGTIQSIEDNKIVMLATAAKNYLKEDTSITIFTDEETTFIRQDKNFDINNVKPGETGQFYKTTTIKLTDLKVGEEITAIDYKNVKDKIEFTAKRIEAVK